MLGTIVVGSTASEIMKSIVVRAHPVTPMANHLVGKGIVEGVLLIGVFPRHLS